MKLKRKLFSALLTICLLLTALPVTTLASSKNLTYTAKTSGSGSAIKVKKVTYDTDDGQKELEIDFTTKVTWRSNAKVSSIKDNKGVTYTGTLKDKDNDECDIVIPKLKTGRTYTIKITGIKKKGTSSYRTLTLTVKVPAATTTKKVTVKKVSVDIDNDDHDKYKTEIEVDFASDVTWRSNAKITSVKDNKGNTYTGILTEKDDDECEIYIKNIKYGRTYTIKISGVKAKGAASYQTITVTAKVPAKTNKLTVKEVDYDVDRKNGKTVYTVEFDFNKNVVKKSNSYIIIRDSSGKAYSSKNSYIEWDKDECELRLSKKLTVGKTYTYKIVNVKSSSESSYRTITGSFVAK